MKIGILRGQENSFPEALIQRINDKSKKQQAGVTAEFVKIGGVRMDEPAEYRVIIDRISQDVPFYRAYLKNAALAGSEIINNPFWWSADDKFFNYALAARLGVATPKTVIVPHNTHPPDTTSESMRNLIYPVDWARLFSYVGFPAFLKPFAGGGWKHVYPVHNADEFFHFYNQTGSLCMTLQEAIDFTEYYRCYCIGRKQVHLMRYDPKRPHHERYVKNALPIPAAMEKRLRQDCVTLCNALGYDINTLEFAVRDGIPYAIDFLNPAPDADYHSVGAENFEWVVEAVSELAIERARQKPAPPKDYLWSNFLKDNRPPSAETKTPSTRRAAAEKKS
jgi:glutathione synthase/RimK-type ligase-like ATP-grasp enzyme